jgi:hypothetical protein
LAFVGVDHADVSGHDPPAVREPDPGLHLAAHLARRRGTVEQGRGHRDVAPVRGDDRARAGARQPERRAGRAEALDRVVAVKVLAAAVADGARIVAKQRIERGHVVAHQRLLVALECRCDLGNDIGLIDVHRLAHLRPFPAS